MNNYRFNNILGSKYWVNCYDKSFAQIQQESNLPLHFRERYKTNTIIQPINNYAFHYSSFPEIIINNFITLRQKTHAEIWVEPKGNALYALDKTWQRQFYPSTTIHSDKECFDAVYKFYTPWVINKNITVKILQIDDSPFKIITDTITFKEGSIDGQWIDFLIKKQGPHIKTNEYGIINIDSNAFDIIIEDTETVNQITRELNGQSYKIYTDR